MQKLSRPLLRINSFYVAATVKPKRTYQKKLGAPKELARAWILFFGVTVILLADQSLRKPSIFRLDQVAGSRGSAGHESEPAPPCGRGKGEARVLDKAYAVSKSWLRIL